MSEFDDDKTQAHVPINNGIMITHYRIEDKIGAGGMGEVYLAEDTKLKRKVALKFLPSHLVTNNEIRTRFVREAQTVAKLNHPNIVSIFEVSEYNGRPFYVMEWVEGESLHYYCHEKPQPIDIIIDFAIQICQGLGEAHRAGIIHRDIKAANIAVDKNHRKKCASSFSHVALTIISLSPISSSSERPTKFRHLPLSGSMFSLTVEATKVSASH